MTDTATALPATKAQSDFERSTRAIRHFYRIQPNLEAFARVFTGNPKMNIQPTATTSMTDGKTIFLRVEIGLGDEKRHDRSVCGKRDALEQLQCEACLVRENMLVALFHEIAHVAYDSFESMDSYDKEKAVEEAVAEAERFGIKGKRLDAIRRSMSERPPSTYNEAAQRISPYLMPLINGLEDARINVRTMDSRKGMRPMFRARATRIFEQGIETSDGRFIHWNEQPENAQVAVALSQYAQGFYSDGWFSEPVAEALRDEDVQRLAKACVESRSASEVYRLAFPIMEKLRGYGFFKAKGEEEEEEPDPLESDEGDPTPDQEDTGGDHDDEGEQAESDDEAGTGASGSGTGDTEEDPDGSELEADPDGHESQDADEDADTEDGGGSGATQEPVSDDDPEQDPDQQDTDSGSQEGADEPTVDADEDEDPDGGAGGDGSDDDLSAPEPGQEDEDSWVPDDEREPGQTGGDDDEGEEESEPEPKTGEPDEVEAATAALCSHSQHNHGEEQEGEAEADPDPDASRREYEVTLIERAISQERDFDEPSAEVYESRILENGRALNMRIVNRYPDKLSLVKMPENVIQQSLGKMRVAFSENKKGSKERNKKSGKVNAKVLGRRVPTEDPRLFQKRNRPGKRDYFVVIGVDVSGSTSQGLRMQNIKSAAYAQAELLDRIGVPFEVWAHTCDTNDIPSSTSSYGVWLETQLYRIKEVGERWDTKTKTKLESLVPSAANLDGHTMEFYRKRLDKSQATDKLIMYYTDGDMPMENYREELHILKRELALCKQKGYEVVGVGFETDSPTRHGLPTVRIDGIEDVPKVVRELHDRLAR